MPRQNRAKTRQRQTEIVRLLHQGLTPKTVAEKLHVSPSTVYRTKHGQAQAEQVSDQLVDEMTEFRSQRRAGFSLGEDDD